MSATVMKYEEARKCMKNSVCYYSTIGKIMKECLLNTVIH